MWTKTKVISAGGLNPQIVYLHLDSFVCLFIYLLISTQVNNKSYNIGKSSQNTTLDKHEEPTTPTQLLANTG